MSDRASWLTTSQNYSLEVACRSAQEAFIGIGYGLYHVGSSLERADWRDVDLRVIAYDRVYDQLFGGNKALLYFLNAAVSEWIGARTGLPIDFQIQRQTDANLEFKGRPRNAVGIWVAHLGDTP